MYFFLDAAGRRARGGSLYLEFQPGHYREKHWQADSVYLPAPLFDDLGLYELFVRAIPHFNYYYYTEVTAEQFRLLRALAREHPTQCAEEIIEELAPVASVWLEQFGCFTICGI